MSTATSLKTHHWWGQGTHVLMKKNTIVANSTNAHKIMIRLVIPENVNNAEKTRVWDFKLNWPKHTKWIKRDAEKQLPFTSYLDKIVHLSISITIKIYIFVVTWIGPHVLPIMGIFMVLLPPYIDTLDIKGKYSYLTNEELQQVINDHKLHARKHFNTALMRRRKEEWQKLNIKIKKTF